MGSIKPVPLQAEEGAASIREAHAAGYIEDMCAELAVLARAGNLPVLAYLLDLARIEASMCRRQTAEGAEADLRKPG